MKGIIRVGNRCQNPTIQKFSLLNARRFARENRSIPSTIYHQKHTILDKKAEAEETLKLNQHKMEQSLTNIVPLSTFFEHYIIDDRHTTSLLAPYNGGFVETALLDWLGLSYGYEQIPEDLLDLETSVSQMEIDENEEEKETTVDQEEKMDDKQTEETEDDDEEKTKNKQEEQNDEQEINEEEEEEQRRRDELELEEEYFIRSAVLKPKTTTTTEDLMNESIASKEEDDDGQGKWTVVKKKPYDRRRLIRYILQHATTLTDETIRQTNDDVWQFTTSQRHDLYRYWLLKYQQYLHNSVRGARQEYNQAVSALAEYHQEEDYYILKDSVIVAMTTTCAAKYHTVLEKLRKKIEIKQRIS